MNVFLIGGLASGPDAARREYEQLSDSAQRIGAALASAGHTLMVCSPFVDSFDHGALIGANNVAISNHPVEIEIHHLNLPDVNERIAALKGELRNLRFNPFHYPSPPLGEGTNTGEVRSVAWLLPQIRAMDRSHLTIAVGGRVDGAANMLLHLASARRKALLPLPALGGAAAHAFARHRNDLAEQWGSSFSMLAEPSRIEDVVAQLETVVAGAHIETRTRALPRSVRFFISYPRARPAEADFVEAVLRRQSQIDFQIIRDEHEFDPGHEISAQIRDGIVGADVFVALWCKEYACSPWCNDELETALEQKQRGLQLWILLVDGTRMVPRGARHLLHLPTRSRDEIESKVLAQLSRLLESAATAG